MRLGERAPREEAREAGTRPAPVVAPEAARALALQRAIGNRALVRRVLQRRKSHKNWSLAEADKTRSDIDRTARPWHTTREIVNKEGKKETVKVGSTLHHMISKTVLDLIVADLHTALSSSDTDVAAAARRFNKALTGAARGAGIGEADREKQLWNLFLNLEAGPSDVIGDPGEGFDASYQVTEEAQGARRFEETAVSKSLRKLEQAYRAGRREARASNELDADTWSAMASALEDAHKAAETAQSLANIRVHEAQWMPFTVLDEHGKPKTNWTRSGARRYPGVGLGEALFQHAGTATAPAAAIPAVTETFKIHKDAEGHNEPSVAYVTFGVPETAIDHVCKRHTYLHFTGVGTDMKATNTFFRDPALGPDAVRALLQRALPDIVKGIRTHIQDAATGIEDYDALLADRDLDLVGIPTAADGELYIKVGVSHDPTGEHVPAPAQPAQAAGDEDDDEPVRKGGRRRKKKNTPKRKDQPAALRPTHGWRMRLKTAAPEGPTADAFTRDELAELM